MTFDKAKVEVAVQIVERWILARLRHQTFFSLFDLNLAIRQLLTALNQRPFKKLPMLSIAFYNKSRASDAMLDRLLHNAYKIE